MTYKVQPTFQTQLNALMRENNNTVGNKINRSVKCNNKKCKYQQAGSCESQTLNIDFAPILGGTKMICKSFVMK